MYNNSITLPMLFVNHAGKKTPHRIDRHGVLNILLNRLILEDLSKILVEFFDGLFQHLFL